MSVFRDIILEPKGFDPRPFCGFHAATKNRKDSGFTG
jgi:hypothetical protein